MTKLTFIGDVHGMWSPLDKMLRKLNKKTNPDLIVQVGDIGLGFHKNDPERKFPSNFRFIRGNHDSPAVCRANASYLGDFGYLEEHKMFYMGGADSIDKNNRIPNLTWWENEQLDYGELQDAIDLCLRTQPEIIVTHDAPKFLYNRLTLGSFGANGEIANRTCNALNVLFELYQPKYWFFGHHHTEQNFDVKGTKFFCVQILKTITLDTETMNIVAQPSERKSRKLILS